MKHGLQLIAGGIFALLAFSIGANAQKSAKLYYFEDDMCFGGSFNGVSPSGKYAVGCSSDFSESSYIWERESGRVTLITGSIDERSEAYDVSDDGTVVGLFKDPKSVDDKNKPVLVPGYWKDGKWTALPRFKGMGVFGSGMNGVASKISGDGKTIVGYLPCAMGMMSPAVWIDGELQPKLDGELLGQGAIANSISDDRKVLAGWAEHDSGARSPAAWVDGKMTRIDGLTFDVEVDEFFFEGSASYVSPDGKYVTGYYSPQGNATSCKPFIWSQENGTEYYASGGLGTVVTNEGIVYGSGGYMGSATIYKDKVVQTLDSYLEENYGFNPADYSFSMSNVMGISEDGKVLAGWGVNAVSMGAIMIPIIIILEESIPDNIVTEQAGNIRISSSVVADRLYINGEYNSVEVYNSTGKLVLADNKQAGSVSLGNQEDGIYFVKVFNGEHSKSFKVILQK